MKTQDKVIDRPTGDNPVAKKNSEFSDGLKDGFPIAIGYLPVAISFGIIASANGFSFLITTLMSALCFTGTGQFAGMTHIMDGVGYLGIALSIFVINLRCGIFSISLSQRLEPNLPVWKKMLLSFGNADETFLVATQKRKVVTYKYFMGIITIPYAAWILGTVAGALLAGIFPQSISTACKIALFALYIAIIVPSLKNCKPAVFTVAVAATCSGLLYWVPFLKNNIDSAMSMILGTFIAAILAAIRYPVEVKED